METKPKKTILEESTKDGESDKPDAALELVRHIYDPSPDKLAGMTRLPLDQVRPCSFARVFAEEMIEQCKLARESQALYTENWKLWHSEQREIPGIGRRVPPDPNYKEPKKRGFLDSLFGNKEKPDLTLPDSPERRFFPVDYHPDVIDVENDPRFVIPDIKNSIVYKWLSQYYLHRRSTTPDFSMGAIELASRQIESKPTEDEPIDYSKIMKQ